MSVGACHWQRISPEGRLQNGSGGGMKTGFTQLATL